MTIYIVDIEPIETRYTAQWQTFIPKQLGMLTKEKIVNISGEAGAVKPTPGAFLNFASTNVYKTHQMETISRLFEGNQVFSGDYFLFTDAWNPTVIQLRYMAELLGIDIKIGGMWHAGSYDSYDFLGRLIGDAPWVRHAELSMFNAYDHNFFATKYHIELFSASFPGIDLDKIVQVGWPMEYMNSILEPFKTREKRDVILFPHRLAPEKQLDIFKDLQKSLPEYKLVVCQERELTKGQYHSLLAEAKIVFSANLQETLGISWYEGLLLDTIPMVPDRLSYSEMANKMFKYPSEWTTSFDTYMIYKENIIGQIREFMENYENYLGLMQLQTEQLSNNYFSGEKLYNTINSQEES